MEEINNGTYQACRVKGLCIIEWVENVIEEQLQLSMNREKTKVVDLKQQGGFLDFLGFTLRYDKDLYGRAQMYLNTFPSKKDVAHHRQELHAVTNSGYKHAVKDIIARVNEINRGWKNYFKVGYPRECFRP